ncbi:MAG TPA: tRNA pseudouridine(13) synthase TruD [Thermopetrobacter sp.]|nr:tRNA pseudouridine(13) synthase TruD [Thermopetrobacter sp.]
MPELPEFDPELPSPWGPPPGRADFKRRPEDFHVVELIHPVPEDTGEHLWLRVRKRGINTDQAARRLARLAGIPPRRVAHAGLKDRQAVAEQWFSLHLPGRFDRDDALARHAEPTLEVLEAIRHTRRLRPGALHGNRFRIRLRDIQGDADAVAERLYRIVAQGFPNYFGPQRFGHAYRNWEDGLRLLQGESGRIDRHRRGLLMSALRSHLFNRVLAARVRDGIWNRCLAGDLMQLDGRSACFTAEACDATLEERLARGEIHPTGPLPGRVTRAPAGVAAQYEREVLAPFAPVVEGLERLGVESGRRALRAPVHEFSVRHEDGDLEVAFRLPPGSYATVFLAMAVELTGPVPPHPVLR